MWHRFDLHAHSYYSADAASSPEELIDAAKARGLSGLAITDHDTCDAHAHLIKAGLERSDGEPVEGFLVVPGVEVSTTDGHLLCLGTILPDMRGQRAWEVLEAVSDRGGVAVPSHPFDRWRSGIKPEILDTLPLQAIEVFNAAVSSRHYNRDALAYASRRGLSMTASSDAHHASAVGISVTAFDLEALNLSSLLEALIKGGTPEGQYLSMKEAVKKHFGNWFRAARRRGP